MTTFPATSSTLSAQALRSFAIDNYGLDENATCGLVKTGINHTYLVKSGEARYALRIYSCNWRTRTEVEEEVNLLNLLKERNISISYPISGKTGAYIYEINAPEGIRYAVLFSFAEGDKIRVMDEEKCENTGALTARIHEAASGITLQRTNYDTNVLLDISYGYVKGFFSEGLPEIKYIRDTCIEIKKIFAEGDMKNVRRGAVHLDIWYDNMSIKSKNEITIFDFDFCGNGWLILDIAYFCKQLFHIEADKEIYEQKVKAFLNGYQSVRKLTHTELYMAPYAAAALWIFYLGVQCKRFDWSNVFLTENYLKMLFTPRIKSWLDYYKGKGGFTQP